MCVSAPEDPEREKTGDVRDARSTVDGESAGMLVEWKAGMTPVKSGTQSYLYHTKKTNTEQLRSS